MARKRLTPARLLPEDGTTSAPARPPIARMAGESAAEAALAELAGAMDAARAEGRLVEDLALETIDTGHLVRDRLSADDAEMEALKASLRARGQQTPIEVVPTAEGRYGLISGWRRVTALRALHAETGAEGFATVRALLRRPESAAETYQAMIDENEIRVGLSHWERARIAAKAAELGIYPSPRDAIRGLFATASRAKRSKIGSFMALHEALDGVLRFPVALGERQGLALAQALEARPGLAGEIAAALAAAPPADAAAEQSVLARALARRDPAIRRPEPAGDALQVRRKGRRLIVEGPGVDDALAADLAAWLAARR